jgi:hypothetical protein
MIQVVLYGGLGSIPSLREGGGREREREKETERERGEGGRRMGKKEI